MGALPPNPRRSPPRWLGGNYSALRLAAVAGGRRVRIAASGEVKLRGRTLVFTVPRPGARCSYLPVSPEDLFTAALGLSGGWKVARCEFHGEPKRLELWLDFTPGTRFAVTGQKELCPVHDTVDKEWRHLNFFQFETVLHARVPRVWTAEGKVVQVELPWARPGSGFTLLFEALAMMLCQHMPVSDAAALLAEQDTRLWRVVMHYVEKAQSARDWSQVKRVMVDETSARRGHRYVSCFVTPTRARCS
jgi:transposase